MLLNHTSGIPEMLSDPVLARIAAEPEKVWSEEEWLDLAAAQSPFFRPGEGWQYSNTDYVLLGLVIERATGHPWRREVRRRIIEPLDLDDTLLPEPGDLSIPGTFAHGYLTIEGELLDITRVDPSMAGAAGGSALVTTTRDLTRFMEALLSGQLFRRKGTLEEMLTYVDAPDDSGLPHYYGLGLEKYVLADGLELVGHAGATAGYAATVMRLPALDTTVAAAINIEDTMSVYGNIVLPVIETLKEKSAP
jgi:D-alanyl-D-alanine carboxypeptidase